MQILLHGKQLCIEGRFAMWQWGVVKNETLRQEMILIFPLWTFHLYVATFQQHLHMEYISLSWYDIPELLVSIRISLIEGCCKQGSYSKVLVSTMTWLSIMEYLCHKWPRTCSTCRKHSPVLFSLMNHHRVCN